MNVEFSEEQEQLRSSVRGLLERMAPVRDMARARWHEPAPMTSELWRALGDLGVLGLLAPVEAGGSGASMVDCGPVLEELGRALVPGPFESTVGATTILGASPVPAARQVLDEIVAGRTWAALADARPDDEWAVDGGAVTGVASRVADAQGASALILVREDAAWLVDDADAVATTPVEGVDGGHPVADVVLAQALAVDLGVGAATIGLARRRVVVGSVLDGIGAAEAALAMAVAYAGERQQFGKPIGSFQAVQHLCADMLCDLEESRVAAYYAMWALDAADEGEQARAVALTKAVASDALYRVGANAIQVFGGVGFTWEHDIGLYYRRLVALQQRHGGSRQHLAALAELVF